MSTLIVIVAGVTSALREPCSTAYYYNDDDDRLAEMRFVLDAFVFWHWSHQTRSLRTQYGILIPYATRSATGKTKIETICTPPADRPLTYSGVCAVPKTHAIFNGSHWTRSRYVSRTRVRYISVSHGGYAST